MQKSGRRPTLTKWRLVLYLVYYMPRQKCKLFPAGAILSTREHSISAAFAPCARGLPALGPRTQVAGARPRSAGNSRIRAILCYIITIARTPAPLRPAGDLYNPLESSVLCRIKALRMQVVSPLLSGEIPRERYETTRQPPHTRLRHMLHCVGFFQWVLGKDR